MTIKIQRAWRRRLARLNQAARTIQGYWRAHSRNNIGAAKALSFVTRLLHTTTSVQPILLTGMGNVMSNVQILIQQSTLNKRDNAANRIQMAWKMYKKQRYVA